MQANQAHLINVNRTVHAEYSRLVASEAEGLWIGLSVRSDDGILRWTPSNRPVDESDDGPFAHLFHRSPLLVDESRHCATLYGKASIHSRDGVRFDLRECSSNSAALQHGASLTLSSLEDVASGGK